MTNEQSRIINGLSPIWTAFSGGHMEFLNQRPLPKYGPSGGARGCENRRKDL